MNRRFAIVVFAVCILLLLPVSAHADVVGWNEFLGDVRDETEPLDRNEFVVNAPEGDFTLKEKPGSKKAARPWGEPITYENGSRIWLSLVYKYKGDYWGIEPPSHSAYDIGWIPMNYVLAEFATQDFNNIHIDEFYSNMESFELSPQAKNLTVWKWPGSDREKIVFGVDDLVGYSFPVIHVWKDPEGREWGYLDIAFYSFWFESSIEGWVYMDDPENKGVLPPFYPAPNPQAWSKDGVYDWSLDTPSGSTGGDPQNGSSAPPESAPDGLTQFYLLIAIIIAAAVTGVVLLVVLYRRIAKKQQEKDKKSII